MITRKQVGLPSQHEPQPTAFALHEALPEQNGSENFVFSPDVIPAKQINPPVGAAMKSSGKKIGNGHLNLHEAELLSGTSSSVTNSMWDEQPVDELIKSSARCDHNELIVKDLRPSSELLDSGEGTGYDSKGHLSSTSQTKTYTHQATLSVNHPDGGESSRKETGGAYGLALDTYQSK